MSRQTKEMSLHSAARASRVDTIRELLYVQQCDPSAPNVYGKTAAYMYFISLLNKANSDVSFTADEIACFTELLWFTYDTQRSSDERERKEIFDMLDYCFQFSDVPIRRIFLEIVNAFITPSHHRRYFVEKILEAKLSSDYCLIATMFDPNDLLTDGEDFIGLRSNFLCELFALFIANASFFEEYLAEVMSSGWVFTVTEQSWAFCSALTKDQPIASVFSFMKYIISYQIDFDDLLERCINQLPPELADIIGIHVFVPLSNFINAPMRLASILRRKRTTQSTYYNFNETEDVLDDFNAFLGLEQNTFQIVSLKNLARMTIRKHFFRRHTHYKGLSLLYSLNNVPTTLRNFICYNYRNSKF